MRICLLSKEFAPHSAWGPLGVYNYHLAQGLKALGQQIEVVSLSSNHTSSSALEDDILVHRVPYQSSMSGSRELIMSTPATHFMLKTNMVLWNKFLQLHQNNPFDVLEVSDRLAEGVLPAAAKILPVVIRVHEPYAKLLSAEPAYNSPSFDQHFIALLERLSAVSAAGIIATSQSTAEFLIADLNLPENTIQLIETKAAESTRQEIASLSQFTYERVVQQSSSAQFDRRVTGIYRRRQEQAIIDAANLIYAYQEMLYNLLFAQSWRFRIRHWWLLMTSNPQLFAWKIVVQVASRLLGTRAATSPYLAQLRQEISKAESRRRQKQALELGCLT